MQITVEIRPFYNNDFEGTFPNLARALETAGSGFGGKQPSLYELAGQTDRLLYQSDGTSLRELLMRHKDDLKKLYRSIEKSIADRNLSAADKLLYQIEDIFEKIESGLN